MALGEIAERLGSAGWLDDPERMRPYLEEERGRYHGQAHGVASPATVEQLSWVVGHCAAAGIAIVPQGGHTGLCGGAVPLAGERPVIVLSLRRLDRIRALDPVNGTITVEAGCILARIQEAAAEAGRLFPLSLAAEGSCQIGGNLATNAGGTNALRYGVARDLVLGLEVVLADGRIWSGLRTLKKDNTGYDLKNLFIGSEGTLGIITAAVLRLFPAPEETRTALLAVDSPAAALSLLTRLQQATDGRLQACELMSARSVRFSTRHIPGCRDPFDEAPPWYLLVEAGGRHLGESVLAALEQALEAGQLLDAAIAESGAQADSFWRLRESIPEAQKAEGGSIKHDVSVPVASVPAFLDQATAAVEAAYPGARVCAFGHLGDGNIHFNVSQPPAADRAEFLAQWETCNRLVHDIVHAMEGSISAEHGIGLLKRDELPRYQSPVALDLMRRIKRALDPDNLLNPGKVIALD